MEQTRTTAHARFALAAILLLAPACSAPRHAVERDTGRWQLSRTDTGIFLLDSATGDLWRMDNLGEGGLRWSLMLRGPTAPDSTSTASSGAR